MESGKEVCAGDYLCRIDLSEEVTLKKSGENDRMKTREYKTENLKKLYWLGK